MNSNIQTEKYYIQIDDLYEDENTCKIDKDKKNDEGEDYYEEEGKDKTILNIYNMNSIVYPNEKIYEVAPIIEEIIVERDNSQPNCCLVNCQNFIAMLLNIATQIYMFLENMIKIFSTILVIIDIFNITKGKIKINGRSKYNYFTIESAQSERFRRIVYWYYYNNITPDEEQWVSTIKTFNLLEVPPFTIRLYIDNEKSQYSIELSSITLKTDTNKGTRTINLYEDIINELIDNVLIICGKRLLKTADGTIPIGGLLPEKFISDLGVNKINKNQ
jgi:hypothetical protein